MTPGALGGWSWRIRVLVPGGGIVFETTHALRMLEINSS
jgi:hypothetical protein